MFHLDIEFEKFLLEETNRQLKALPIDDLQREDIRPKKSFPPQSNFERDGEAGLEHKAVEFDIENTPTDFNDKTLLEVTIPLAVAEDGRQPGIHNPIVYESPANLRIGADVTKLHPPFRDTYDDYLAVLNKPFQQLSSFRHKLDRH